MAEHKDYGLSGVHRTLQMGKQGPKIVGDSDTNSFSVTREDAATLTTLSGANASNATHFVTKAQLDSVQTAEATLTSGIDNTTTSFSLGTIPGGMKTIITTVTVSAVWDADPAISISDGGSSVLINSNYIDFETQGSYQTISTIDNLGDTAYSVSLTPGGSTGTATIVVSYY